MQLVYSTAPADWTDILLDEANLEQFSYILKFEYFLKVLLKPFICCISCKQIWFPFTPPQII